MKRKHLTVPENRRKQTNKTTKNRKFETAFSYFLCCSVLVGGFIIFFFFDLNTEKTSAGNADDEIEKAMFTRQEFFGAEAIVPLPTTEAQANLAKLAENAPENPQILEKLADADEKLARFDEAENDLLRLSAIDTSKLEILARFYERRAEFEKEAEILKKILFSTEAAKRAAVFERLIEQARLHDLKSYLQKDFYNEVAKENPNLYQIFEKLIDNLKEEKNYTEALNFTRQAKAQFPARQNVLLKKEVEILLEINKSKEAEAVYQAAFNPFWTERQADEFYDFLNEQDRLRAYGAEVKERFRKNPADFDAAIRFALYQNHDYSYGNDRLAPVIIKLEQAKKSWTTEELVTVSRLLLQSNEGELASRFLYTLYAREDFQKNRELRAKVLYQLFEMFSDAENQKLPITKGDLRFYEDVAKTDTNPGIATGILSLIFSDTNPREKLNEQETKAVKYFNRAAAYRIFEEYKKENPNSTELSQMYLDLARLYTATKEIETAAKILDEFAAKYHNSDDYADAALKLADAFVAVKNFEKSREIYRNLLDYLGKNQKPKREPQTDFAVQSIIDFKDSSDNQISANNNSDEEISDQEVPLIRNAGINIPDEKAETRNNYYSDEPSGKFNDYLDRKKVETTYEEVLEKLIASLSNEKKTAEILAVYSNEIAKYPDQEWLYEQRLSWLEQTNLVDEQLQIYKEALKRFQNDNWRDKLARFFVRRKRNDEFSEFSKKLVGELNDAEIQNYFSEFVDGKISANDFDGLLYFNLYQSAHERFPHNLNFVNGLLRFYQTRKQEKEWRRLAAAYYFESKPTREQFLDNLARNGDLRVFLAQSQTSENTIYELFRADSYARLSNYENAVESYRKLNLIYPNTPEFAERLIAFTRSFGQKNRQLLIEAANISKTQADFEPSSAQRRTQSGEIFAELGNYDESRQEWEKLIATAKGDKEIYLDAATIYWDYFQYDDALRTLKKLREKFNDDTLYAFETGAILEARHKKNEAIGEYVKALAATDDDGIQKEKSLKRLKFLTANSVEKSEVKPDGNGFEIFRLIDSEFESEKNRRNDSAFLSLGYAEFLARTKQTVKAENVLNKAIRQSSDSAFLEAAKNFYQMRESKTGEQIALQRLAEITSSPRRKIQFSLQLAESFEENKDRNSAKNILRELVAKFPNNYGVLIETSDFYKRLGFENESAQVLQNALPRSKGAYRSAVARKLAARLININRLDSAEQILVNLHEEDKADEGVFRELAKICVRTGNAELMRKSFAETIGEMKKSDVDRRELDDETAKLRTEMIDAFTRLKDYKSAIEQHIEIINREPENEDSTENAVSYVRRYGGAETLLNYYLKLSAEAFKNYRWNVVLARIYESNNDAENAVKNYRTAVVNQPEMPELYLAIAEIEAKRNNYDEALKNLDEVLELTDNAPENVKKKIEVLKKAGRFGEIEAEKAKLPAESKNKVQTDQFAEARELAETEKEKSREIYRQAFENLLENPIKEEFKVADISAYVQSERETEPLDQIYKRLWQLRENLISIADENNSTDAGEALKRLGILDGAIVESIGNIAGKFGTDEEVAALHEDLRRKIVENSYVSDNHRFFSSIQNLSRRAGFGDLEEMILRKKIDETVSDADRKTCVQNLVNFYNERGAYQKALDILEKNQPDNLSAIAETTRIVGNREKELAALRTIYWKAFDKKIAQNDTDVARYLEILRAEDRVELQTVAGKSSAYQVQLINFLLGIGEAKLAHSAIENSNFSVAWKAARNAETSLALREIDESSECYFCAALQFYSIGDLLNQSPDEKRFLINDDWFRLTREYGEWVGEKAKPEASAEADKYLPAMTENLPKNSDEQAKLGAYYLDRNELNQAIEHFRLAVEIDPADATARTSLGAAYYKIGRVDYAQESWAKVLEGETIQDGLIYFQTMREYGLSETGRANVSPIIVKFLQANDADKSAEFQQLIRAVAESFTGESEKSAYFLQILKERPTDKSLAAMLINENLIHENEQNKFYELLLERSDDLNDYDYDFQTIAGRVWSAADAESIYDQENEYKSGESNDEGFEWREKYLKWLIEHGETSKSARLIAEIEKQINGKRARPAWLRLAKIELKIQENKFDSAEAEYFIGIKVSDSATEIIPPSVERFNDVLQILQKENRGTEAIRLNESFFARMLALEQLDAANFVGMARNYFQKGERENALRILRLMIAASDENGKETALAEIASLEAVKINAANAAKLPSNQNNSINQINALQLAAETVYEFKENEKAVEFRRELAAINPSDAANKINLAEILITLNQKDEAGRILQNIIGDRNSLRAARWQAREILRESDENAEFPNIGFDSFSQFYCGIFNEKSNQNEAATECLINSLIADKDAEIPARPELVKLYAVTGKPFAALKFADSIKSAKPDELLQTLSEAARNVGDFAKAVEFEKSKTYQDYSRIEFLQKLADEKNKRATDFTVDSENTRRL